MSRSLWKGSFSDSILWSVDFLENKKKTLFSRRSNIPSYLLGTYVFVYNGQTFNKVNITEDKIGKKFGAFVKTRRMNVKKKKKKK